MWNSKKKAAKIAICLFWYFDKLLFANRDEWFTGHSDRQYGQLIMLQLLNQLLESFADDEVNANSDKLFHLLRIMRQKIVRSHLPGNSILNHRHPSSKLKH